MGILQVDFRYMCGGFSVAETISDLINFLQERRQNRFGLQSAGRFRSTFGTGAPWWPTEIVYAYVSKSPMEFIGHGWHWIKRSVAVSFHFKICATPVKIQRNRARAQCHVRSSNRVGESALERFVARLLISPSHLGIH